MKVNRIFKILNVTGIIILMLFIVIGYYTNTHKFFEDSKTNDGYGGFTLQRNANEFIVDGCGSGTMLDTVTGLCWLKNMSYFGNIDWSSASNDCENLDYGGYTDWHLPTRDELRTLLDRIGGAGSTCLRLQSFGFTNCQNNFYWTSDIYSTDDTHAWDITLNNGFDYDDSKSYPYYVICVKRVPN